MKIALAQFNFHVGNFSFNTEKIVSGIIEAKANGAKLIVFPEMSVTGYPPGDLLEFSSFIERCSDSIKIIAEHCKGISAVVGCPETNRDSKGKALYNSAMLISNGRISFVARKTLLPDYDVFDEYRYFEPNRVFNVIDIEGVKIALTVCEDLWNVRANPLYINTPMEELIKQSPDLIINIAASPFHSSHHSEREEILSANAVNYKIPVVYVNQTGAQTELIFDGGSMVVNARGEKVMQLPFFNEALDFIETSEINNMPVLKPDNFSEIQLIQDALVLGIKDYFGKMGFRKAILGLSGGIDSAVCLVLACKALGADNVRAVLMPSKFSSEHSVDDARELALNLGCQWDLIPIADVYESFEKTLEPVFKGLPFNITEENLQSRARGVILMALSNKFGYILLNTSNKSEAAVGYGTLYGDMCGGLAVIADVYKTKVYELAHLFNAEKEIIPLNTIIKPPSAELRPDQKDSDSLPDYDILDKILYLYIEEGKGPEEITAAGFDSSIVKRVLNLVNTSEYKRFQSPPVLRLTSKSFGVGRRMPIEGKYLY